MARRKAKTDHDADYLKALHHFYGECASFLKDKTLESAIGPDLRKMEMACLTLERATMASSGLTDAMSDFQREFLEQQDDSRVQETIEATHDDPADLPVTEAVTQTLEEVYLEEELMAADQESARRLAIMTTHDES